MLIAVRGHPARALKMAVVYKARAVGFDYSFLIPATGDRTPCVYVENGRVVNYDPNDPYINYPSDTTKLEHVGRFTLTTLSSVPGVDEITTRL